MSGRGFTMIETFVAITILLISVVGPLSLVAKFYADNTYARNQIAASFFAQDEIEAVNNILRNNKLKFNEGESCTAEQLRNTTSWLGPLKDCNNVECDVDSIDGSIRNSNPDISERGYRLYKLTNGFYRNYQPTGEEYAATPYYRKMTLKNLYSGTSAPDPFLDDKADIRAADVKVEVHWQYKGEWQKPVIVLSRVILHQCL